MSRQVDRRVGSRQRSLFVVALVSVLALACDGGPDTPARRSAVLTGKPGCQVGVIGDSLTVAARDRGGLAAKLAGAGCEAAAIDAVGSRTTASGAGTAERWAASGRMPRVLVVALGTNDCADPNFAHNVRRVRDAVGPQGQLAWLNIHRAGCDAAANDALLRVQAETTRGGAGRFWLVDQRHWLSANQHLLRPDRVHLTEQGAAGMADRIAAVVTRGDGCEDQICK